MESIIYDKCDLKIGMLGIRIREVRKREGNMSMLTLANHIGCSATHISEIEKGKSVPTVQDLFGICAVCNTDFYYLLRDSIDYEKILEDQNAAQASDILPTVVMQLLAASNILKDCDDGIEASLNKLLETEKNIERLLMASNQLQQEEIIPKLAAILEGQQQE